MAMISIFFFQKKKYQTEKQKKKYVLKSRELQAEDASDLYRVSREVHKLRHDLLGKLEVMNRLIKKGRYEEVAQYIEKMGVRLGDYPELPQETGNEGLNVALIMANQECQKRKIKFLYSVIGCPDSVDFMDMVTLVQNLLMNGIEACINVSSEKILYFSLRVEDGTTEIELENSIEESVLKTNPNLESRKAKKDEHGFGLQNIREIVKKYQGEYLYWEERKRFIQKICLNHHSVEYKQNTIINEEILG